LGYHISTNDTLIVSGELMNMLELTQEVVFSMVWELIASPPPDFECATPYWLDVGGCDDSDVPAEVDSQYAYTSPVVTANFDGELAFVAGHLHDGGTHLDLLRNNEMVCSMDASYRALDPATSPAEHIAQIRTCLDAGKTTVGDRWSIRAHYDTFIRAPMNANDGTLEPVMGIALAYVVVAERVGGSKAIYVIETVFMLAFLAIVCATRVMPRRPIKVSDAYEVLGQK